MKDRLTIGEFAKLRNITTETLRYYDRAGILKPVEVDETTGYRYYSILQYEKLGTIKELRQLGMSIDEIKKYFDNRNLGQSVDILKDKHEELKKKIKELKKLERSIGEKLSHLEKISESLDFHEIEIKTIKEREIIVFDKSVDNDIDLSYACLKLENELREISPILGSNRYGSIIKKEEMEAGDYQKIMMFLFIKDKSHIDKDEIVKIAGGDYACMYYTGSIWEVEKHLSKMKAYIDEKGYKICGDILQIMQIDISVTDRQSEVMMEIQVPVMR